MKYQDFHVGDMARATHKNKPCDVATFEVTMLINGLYSRENIFEADRFNFELVSCPHQPEKRVESEIQIGDLVRATNKRYLENVSVFRVTEVERYGLRSSSNSFTRDQHTFEVLEKARDEEHDRLVELVVNTFRRSMGYTTPFEKLEETSKKGYRDAASTIIDIINKDQEN